MSTVNGAQFEELRRQLGMPECQHCGQAMLALLHCVQRYVDGELIPVQRGLLTFYVPALREPACGSMRRTDRSSIAPPRAREDPGMFWTGSLFPHILEAFRSKLSPSEAQQVRTFTHSFFWDDVPAIVGFLSPSPGFRSRDFA